ncbi:trigger factor [Actinomycetaceae bacterium TAE3-ERU4]|nr:trigger factor [Actinomycetaceae bacterium TAE3-ERU4]
MKSTVETLEPTKVKLTVEVPAQELDQPMKAAYKEISQQVSVPGFRKGKVPPRIIDQRIGRSYVIQTAIDKALGGLYREALLENNIKPLAQPEVSIDKIPSESGAFDGELVFTAEILCVPEFELPELKDIEITVDQIEVADADVENEIENLRKRFGTLKNADRAAKDGDFVSIDLTASIDDEEIDSMSGVSYEVGSKTMLEGLDEALVGLAVDEDTTFESELAGGEHAGEKAVIKVTVRSVKERELPEVDEDFVQMASEFDTVEELKADIKKQVEDQKRAEQAVDARDKLVEVLSEKVELPLPKQIIDESVEGQEGNKEELRAQAEASLRKEILLDRLVEETGVKVEQQDLLQFVFQASQAYGIEPQQLLSDQQQMASIYAELARTKAVAASLADVKVKDTEGNDVDMSEFTKDALGEDTAEETQEEKPAKKPAAKKTTAKKATEKKPAAKKTTAKKATEKKPAAKKTTAKKATEKKPAAKKTAAKKED